MGCDCRKSGNVSVAILPTQFEGSLMKSIPLNSKEVALPPELKRAMATEAEAMRGARAIVIAAQGEKDASMALREASRVLCESPGALQLRYLQTLTTIAAEKNSTVIFPLPMEILKAFGN